MNGVGSAQDVVAVRMSINTQYVRQCRLAVRRQWALPECERSACIREHTATNPAHPVAREGRRAACADARQRAGAYRHGRIRTKRASSRHGNAPRAHRIRTNTVPHCTVHVRPRFAKRHAVNAAARRLDTLRALPTNGYDASRTNWHSHCITRCGESTTICAARCTRQQFFLITAFWTVASPEPVFGPR